MFHYYNTLIYVNNLILDPGDMPRSTMIEKMEKLKLGELTLSENVKAGMFAAGMFLPGSLMRVTYALAIFFVLLDFIGDWFGAGMFLPNFSD